MAKVLVTGGAGFLGSHLCERLVEQGHDVLCVDNYFTGSRGNIAHLIGNPRFEVMRHDVTFPLYVEVDQIYNLACPASPIHYQFDPVQTTKTSVHGAINMLGLAKRVKAKILQASTSEVYGDPEIHPQVESYWGHVNPIGLRSCYDEGKRCAETLFFDYWRQHGLRIKVVRIFNTYGPRMHPNDGRVVSNFIVQALAGNDITIYGDGSQTRSFCYVDDLIEAMIRTMNTPNDFTGADQHRQSARVHHPPTGRTGDRDDRIAQQAGVRPATVGRSASKAAEYFIGPLGSRLGTDHSSQPWPREDHRLLPWSAESGSGIASTRDWTAHAVLRRQKACTVKLTFNTASPAVRSADPPGWTSRASTKT